MERNRWNDQKCVHEQSFKILPNVNMMCRGIKQGPVVGNDEDQVTYPAKDAEKFHQVHLSHAFNTFKVFKFIHVLHLKDFEI